MATITTLPITTHTAWMCTVHTFAAKARRDYPSLGGKVDKALALVLAGAVVPTSEPQRYLERETPVATAAASEMAFSLTLKGPIRGLDGCLTIRGQTREEFFRHLQDVLDLSTREEALREHLRCARDDARHAGTPRADT